MWKSYVRGNARDDELTRLIVQKIEEYSGPKDLSEVEIQVGELLLDSSTQHWRQAVRFYSPWGLHKLSVVSGHEVEIA